MPLELTKDQIDDLREIHLVCTQLHTEFVIIGATAYKLYFGDDHRFTEDIDVVIALDLDAFSEFARRLEAAEWERKPARENRWRSRRGSYFDILPAGPQLRLDKQIVWPESEFVMNLIGFDHVFSEAQIHQIVPDFSIKAVPPHVLALTKIISFMDDPQRRAKDLGDIQSLLARYEEESDRIFDDLVFEAALPDIGLANAFLLGLDLAKLCTAEERNIVNTFLLRFTDDRDDDPFVARLGAFKKGFEHS